MLSIAQMATTRLMNLKVESMFQIDDLRYRSQALGLEATKHCNIVVAHTASLLQKEGLRKLVNNNLYFTLRETTVAPKLSRL